MNGNDFMTWMLRSPFHGILNGMMLITVTGRKTGRQYTTPVGYYEQDGYLWILSNRDRTWWRNLQGGATVELFLKRKPAHAQAEVELEGCDVEKHISDYVRHIPQAARSLGIRMENKNPNPEDVAKVARDRVFVKLKIVSGGFSNN